MEAIFNTSVQKDLIDILDLPYSLRKTRFKEKINKVNTIFKTQLAYLHSFYLT
jgi:hypothetical protein